MAAGLHLRAPAVLRATWPALAADEGALTEPSRKRRDAARVRVAITDAMMALESGVTSVPDLLYRAEPDSNRQGLFER